MKRLWISAIAIVLLAGICFCGRVVVSSKTDNIKKAVREIRICAENGQISKAKMLSRKLERDWVKDEKTLSLFVNSDTLSDVGMAVSRIAPLLKDGATGEFYAELYCLRVQIIHIKSHS